MPVYCIEGIFQSLYLYTRGIVDLKYILLLYQAGGAQAVFLSYLF